MALITDPDNLNQGTEITLSTSGKTIALAVAGNLSNDGVTGQALYSFLKEDKCHLTIWDEQYIDDFVFYSQGSSISNETKIKNSHCCQPWDPQWCRKLSIQTRSRGQCLKEKDASQM